MVNYPEFHLNDPFTLTEEVNVPAEKKQDLLNQMWRNQCISDTYEPGSTFKIITAAAALEQGVVKLTDNFYCPGYKLVEDRRIRCAKTTGHGAETFETGIMNSCNPVFIELGENLELKIFINISASLDCSRKQMWICPAKLQRSCIKKKMSVR